MKTRIITPHKKGRNKNIIFRSTPETKTQLKRIAEHYKCSVADIIARYAELNVPMGVEIRYDDEGMWGDFDPDAGGVDVNASYAAYEHLVTDAVRRVYPNARIEYYYGAALDPVTVDGDHLCDTAANIAEIHSQVWQDWKWIVLK